jgi:hypothetical protein
MQINKILDGEIKRSICDGGLFDLLDNLLVSYRGKEIDSFDYNMIIDRYSLYSEFLDKGVAKYRSIVDFVEDNIPEVFEKEFFDIERFEFYRI